MRFFEPIPITQDMDPVTMLRMHRLNSLGSLYYFIKIALKRRRLTESLHLPFCRSMEVDHLHDVIEMPRDHFKSTCSGEGMPMWRVLPLATRDIDDFQALGYDDEFIRHMLRMHDCTKRNLLVSENITNAAKLGSKIRRHYESNDIYRTLFPETLPGPNQRWTDFSLQVRPPDGAPPHGEGTFDFIGVGGATQSRHYNGLIIQDDLVGRKAIESVSVMEKTIEYHKLVSSLYDSTDADHEGDELVIGNRWGYRDLNSHIREHEHFNIQSHSAMGGCCPAHPIDTPIFPEEWSVEKLLTLKERYGNYLFSCFPAGAPVLMADLTDKPVEELAVGDRIVGYSLDKYPNLIEGVVEFVNTRKEVVYEFTTNTGRIIRCTADHKWLKRTHRGSDITSKDYRGGPYAPLGLVSCITGNFLFNEFDLVPVYTPPTQPTADEQRDLDWLGGILDGEGSVNKKCGAIFIAQSPTANPVVWKAIGDCLDRLHIPYNWQASAHSYVIQGARSLKVRLMKFARMYKKDRFRQAWMNNSGRIGNDNRNTDTDIVRERAVKAVCLGEQDVYNIQSSTGNYVAYGFATKNCQYLNNPCAPEDAEFNESDINWYDFYKVSDSAEGSLMIRHEVKNGIIRSDLHYRKLDVVIACDPTHTATGRCRHAIVVLGMSQDNNYYLLESWAEASSHETFFNKIYEIAARWRVTGVGFETCAGQSLALPHFKYLNTVKPNKLRIIPLKGEVEGPDGEITTKKEWRIRNTLGPIIEFGRFFMRRKQQDVLSELTTFPKGKYCDQIDAMAYIPQILRNPTNKVADQKFLRMNQLQQKQIAQPYSNLISQGGPGSHRSAQLRSMFSGRGY